ncbi:RluA family pseudouridine synthase [Variovorax sp. PCZ-1]|nr:RluA family pseudouridine synthase [Variovorax sp. PCZ-1]
MKRQQPYAPPPDTGLQIIYEDADLIAIDKPAGLLSVPGRGALLQDCALHRVLARYPSALLVHRLDEATSGLLLFALSPAVQKALSAAFETRKIHKTYHAWVHGTDLPQSGVIDAPIAADWPHRPLRKIDIHAGQAARTPFYLLSKNEHSAQALCRLEPETGRTHQLRVHMQHIGHPIVGDKLYGLPQDETHRLMLHASGLKFLHPAADARLMELDCPAAF